MNNIFNKGLAFVGIMLLVGAFFWVGDAYAYLDQHFWHIATREPSVIDFWFWPLSWFAAYILSVIPFFIVGLIGMHFEYKEIKQKEQAELDLAEAKKASNLYINTNGSPSTEAHS